MDSYNSFWGSEDGETILAEPNLQKKNAAMIQASERKVTGKDGVEVDRQADLMRLLNMLHEAAVCAAYFCDKKHITKSFEDMFETLLPRHYPWLVEKRKLRADLFYKLECFVRGEFEVDLPEGPADLLCKKEKNRYDADVAKPQFFSRWIRYVFGYA